MPISDATLATIKKLYGCYPMHDEALQHYPSCPFCGFLPKQDGGWMASFENGWDSALQRLVIELGLPEHPADGQKDASPDSPESPLENA